MRTLLGTIALLFAFSAGAASLERYKTFLNGTQSARAQFEQKVYDRSGTQLLYQFSDENREIVTYDHIPQVVVDATVAAEDKSFWTNPGVDLLGIVRAAIYIVCLILLLLAIDLLLVQSRRKIQPGYFTTRITGPRFIPADVMRVKLEGSGKVGERYVGLCGIRDPYTIANVDRVIAWARDKVSERFGKSGYELHYNVYGRDGVMGDLEPLRDKPGHELCVFVQGVGVFDFVSVGA